MSQILRLEYACTKAELEQAQSLNLRKQLGGGSKWRARLYLFFLLIGMLLAFYFRVQEVPEAYRALVIAAIVGCTVLIVYCRRKLRKNVPGTTKIEISEIGFTIHGAASIVKLPWSAFSQCMESPELFVLLDRAKRTLFVIPKRAFPSESWQTWFREQATNGPSLTTLEFCVPLLTAPFTAADRVTFAVQLGFRDSLDRTIASWLTWGIVLGLAAVITGVTFWPDDPPRNAVNSQIKVYFMLCCHLFWCL